MGRDNGAQGGNRLVKVGSVLFGADAELSEWVSSRIPGYVAQPGAKCLGVIHKDRIAAAVAFERFNGAHIEASIAADLSGRWATRQTLRTLFAYPFVQLGAKAISVLVPASNLKSLNLALKLGFDAIAYVPFAAHDGSTLVVLQMYPETCRWLHHGQIFGTAAA